MAIQKKQRRNDFNLCRRVRLSYTRFEAKCRRQPNIDMIPMKGQRKTHHEHMDDDTVVEAAEKQHQNAKQSERKKFGCKRRRFWRRHRRQNFWWLQKLFVFSLTLVRSRDFFDIRCFGTRSVVVGSRARHLFIALAPARLNHYLALYYVFPFRFFFRLDLSEMVFRPPINERKMKERNVTRICVSMKCNVFVNRLHKCHGWEVSSANDRWTMNCNQQQKINEMQNYDYRNCRVRYSGYCHDSWHKHKHTCVWARPNGKCQNEKFVCRSTVGSVNWNDSKNGLRA